MVREIRDMVKRRFHGTLGKRLLGSGKRGINVRLMHRRFMLSSRLLQSHVVTDTGHRHGREHGHRHYLTWVIARSGSLTKPATGRGGKSVGAKNRYDFELVGFWGFLATDSVSVGGRSEIHPFDWGFGNSELSSELLFFVLQCDAIFYPLQLRYVHADEKEARRNP